MNTERTKYFYNNFSDTFIKYYGKTLQVYSPSDMKSYLKQLLKRIDFKNGMNVLDVGCGVCGPAIFFAGNRKINIDAITISQYQAELAKKNISESRLGNSIRVFEMDYHYLDKTILKPEYDVAYFFESLGHTDKYKQVIDELGSLIKIGGILYIKDLFSLNKDDDKNSDITQNRENYYNYKPIVLHKLMEALFYNDFRIEFIEHLDLKINSNNLKKFIGELGFPDDGKETGYWLEIKAIKH